jgi:hypothetical protein
VTDSILDQAILNEQTVILTAGITCLMLPAFMILYRATRETYPGFGLWTTAFVLNGIGSLLLGALPYLSYWVSLWLGNVMILSFPLFLCLGLLVFFGAKDLLGLIWWKPAHLLGSAVLPSFIARHRVPSLRYV